MNEQNEQSWLSLLRASEDRNIGAALQRLAQQAAAAHRREVAEQAREGSAQATLADGDTRR